MQREKQKKRKADEKRMRRMEKKLQNAGDDAETADSREPTVEIDKSTAGDPSAGQSNELPGNSEGE